VFPFSRHLERLLAPAKFALAAKKALSGDAVSAAGGIYHPACFECSQCFRPIEGDSFTVKANKPWCKRCVQLAKEDSRDGVGHAGGPAGGKMKMVNAEIIPCGVCGKELEGKVLRVGDKRFHKECFKCHQCSKQLSDAFRMWDGFPHCNSCASNKTGFTNDFSGDANLGMRVDPKTGQRVANQDTSKASSTAARSVSPALDKPADKPAEKPAEKPAGPKFCGGCGAKSEGAKFCGSCGQKY